MKRKSPPRGAYSVGSGRPPVEHRWKKRESGNRDGGRKKPLTIAAALQKKL